MPSIFLAHSSKDKPFVRKLARELQNHGVKVWLDEADLKVGHSLTEKIGQGIDEVEFVGVVLSENSVNSEWVQKELQIAMQKEIEKRSVVVLPILIEHLEKKAIPPFLRDKIYADFRPPRKFERSLSTFLQSVGISEEVRQGVGAHIKKTLSRGLLQAVRDAQPDAVEAYLNRGADVNVKDEYGRTALILAAKGGNPVIVRSLLKEGADLNASDNYGSTALISAVSEGHNDVAEILIRVGAKAGVDQDCGTAALLKAAGDGHVGIVKALLTAGVQVNAERVWDGSTALIEAAYRGQTNEVRFLLKEGADVDAERSWDGSTALISAANEGHTEVVSILIRNGADADRKDFSGLTAVNYAHENGHAEIIRLLKQVGAED